MVLAKMLTGISGTRNGVDWPSAGEVIELPEEEANDLVAAGMASIESAAMEPKENATLPAAKKRAAK